MEIDPGRAARAAIALTDGAVRIEPNGEGDEFVVSSFSGDDSYRVELGPDGGCTCPDSAYHGATCKHRIALALARGLS